MPTALLPAERSLSSAASELVEQPDCDTTKQSVSSPGRTSEVRNAPGVVTTTGIPRYFRMNGAAHRLAFALDPQAITSTEL